MKKTLTLLIMVFILTSIPCLSQKVDLSPIVKFVNEGQYWKAYKALDESKALSKPTLEVVLLYGKIAMGLGMPDKALKAFNQIIAANPNISDIWEAKADTELILGQESEALQSLKKSLALKGASASAAWKMLFSYNDVPTKEEALNNLSKISPPDYQKVSPLLSAIKALPEKTLNYISDDDKKKEASLHIKEIQGADYVGVKLNESQEAYLVFDTSVREVMIPPDLAEKIGLKPVAQNLPTPFGFNGETAGNYAILPSLRLGDIVYKNLWVRIIPDKWRFFNERYGKRYYKGVLPLCLFKDHDVLFQRRKDVVKLIPKGKITPQTALNTKEIAEIPYLSYGGTTVVVTGCGGKIAPFILSTGLINTTLNENFIDEYGAKSNSTKRVDILMGKQTTLTNVNMSISNVGGKAEDVVTSGSSVTIQDSANLGGFPEYSDFIPNVRIFEKVSVSLANEPFPIIEGPFSPFPMTIPLPVWGAIGRDITNSFTFFFDTTHRKAYALMLD